MRVNRRTFAKGVGGGFLAGMATGLPISPALAKPGGHLHADHYCLGIFDISGIGPVEVILNGTGYASFNNVANYDSFRMADIFSSRTVTMGWEVNRCYGLLGEHLVSATAFVPGRSRYGSVNIITTENRETGSLFPARMVNMLHFLIEIPAMGLRMFNKDPMVLEGDVRQLTVDDINADPRYAANEPARLARIDGGLAGSFDPIGTHHLARPVQFVSVEDETTVLATLVNSTIESLPSYGIDIAMERGEIRGNRVHVDYTISNLTDTPQDVVMYLDDSRYLTLVEGKGTRRRTIGANAQISASGIAEHTGRGEVGQTSCLFCGVNGLATERSDRVAGFHYSDGSDYTTVAPDLAPQ